MQPDYVVSTRSSIFDKVTLEATTKVERKLFAVTVIVPSGYAFRIVNVEHDHKFQDQTSVEPLQGENQTLVETEQAVMSTGGFSYTIKRSDDRSVLLETKSNRLPRISENHMNMICAKYDTGCMSYRSRFLVHLVDRCVYIELG
jgi:hypothetical protein